MVITRQAISNAIKSLALFFGASVVQTVLTCSKCNSLFSYSRVIAFTFCIWILLFEGNSRLTKYVSCKISWLQFPLKRLAVGLASTIGYTLAAIVFLVFIFQTFFGFNFGSSAKFTVIFSLIATLIVSLFLHSREFLLHWRRSTLEAEKFQRQRIAAKYESLKSRVNPQLLFNSLQSLGVLIHSDKETAVKFIKHLSDVYRYILQTRDREVVTRDEEVKFLKSFQFILSVRFGTRLKLTINISDEPFYISPLALQLIIESLIENSAFDTASPLAIEVRTSEAVVRLTANNRFKSNASRGNFETLLTSIHEQYNFLSSHPVVYQLTESMLFCEIPLVFESSGREVVNE
jgi:sensor histidine kinase YesM